MCSFNKPHIVDAKDQGGILLGLALQTGCLGYVAMHKNGELLDYGIIDFKLDRVERATEALQRLLTRFRPSMGCLQDTNEEACCLGKTARTIISEMRVRIDAASIKCRLVSKSQLFALCENLDRPRKHDLAVWLSERYPELRARLPERQKLWDSQPRSMCLFIAAGLALAGMRRARQ